MTRVQAIELVDNHKNALLHPTDILSWTWLRVILLNITDEQWDAALEKAVVTLSN